MNDVTKAVVGLILILCFMCVSFISTYFQFTLGWGLQPANWGWLIATWLTSVFCAVVIQLTGKLFSEN